MLRSMIARHYAKPHRFICVTDDAAGLDGIETFPLWSDWANIPSPHGGNNPSCFRRIKAFSPEARAWFGERFVNIDLDTVIVSDIAPLFDRPEEFVILRDPLYPQQYNGSLWMLTAGSRPQVFDTFDPETSPKAALAAGKKGSDQGWISHCLGPGEAQWTKADGVYNYRWDKVRGGELPADARIVFFTGPVDPWDEAGRVEWISEHYR